MNKFLIILIGLSWTSFSFADEQCQAYCQYNTKADQFKVQTATTADIALKKIQARCGDGTIRDFTCKTVPSVAGSSGSAEIAKLKKENASLKAELENCKLEKAGVINGAHEIKEIRERLDSLIQAQPKTKAE